MKRKILILIGIAISLSISQAQYDTMYFIKGNAVVNQQSIAEADLDSIITYRPGESHFIEPLGPVRVGINRTDLYWMEGGLSAQTTLLDSIRAVGCEYVRFTLQAYTLREQVRDHILYCNQIGLKPLVCIMLGSIKQLYPTGTELVNRLRPGEPRMFWDGYPVSKLDETRFETFMQDVLTYWKNAGCVIDVIELGNELNWIDFNGDLPYYPNGQGKVFNNTYTWNTLPEAVRTFPRKAGFAAKKTKELVTTIFPDNPPRVIVGGLSAGNLNYLGWLVGVGASVLAPDMALKIMKGTAPEQPAGSENYLNGVDGVCLHLYPYGDCPFVENSVTKKADTTKMTNDVIKYFDRWVPAVREISELPIYITEFGYETTTYGAANDWKRAEQYKAYISAMRQSQSKYNWHTLYVYNWDRGTFQIFDGKAMPSAYAIFGGQ